MASKSKSSRRKKSSSGLSFERLLVIGVIGFVVVFAGFIIVDGLSRQAPTVDLAQVPDNSVAVNIQGRDHIADGAEHPAYNSNPPTSGWHYGRDAELGVYRDGLLDETVVHNLEHGHIWLSYRDADDQEALDMLSTLQRQYPNYVIVTYRPTDDTRVAAAAWGRVLTLDELDNDQLQAFILRYRDRAPESIPG